MLGAKSCSRACYQLSPVFRAAKTSSPPSSGPHFIIAASLGRRSWYVVEDVTALGEERNCSSIKHSSMKLGWTSPHSRPQSFDWALWAALPLGVKETKIPPCFSKDRARPNALLGRGTCSRTWAEKKQSN